MARAREHLQFWLVGICLWYTFSARYHTLSAGILRRWNRMYCISGFHNSDPLRAKKSRGYRYPLSRPAHQEEEVMRKS